VWVTNNRTTVEQSGSVRASFDLEIVVRRLHDSDLRAGIHASDAGMQVWISDRLHRVRDERLFEQAGAHLTWREDSVALWLHHAALRLFSDSAYTRRAQGMTARKAERPVAAAGEQGPASAQPLLLIVEDEVMVASGLAETARELGWKVGATVTTQAAAFGAALQLKPDAILMDYRLGDGGDGLAAARRIREATDIPIIYCTAYQRWLSSDMLSVARTKLIAKPVRPASLREALVWATGLGKPPAAAS
jgi:two-component system, response regulator PdtaR